MRGVFFLVVALVVLANVAHAGPRTERGFRNGRPVRIRVVEISGVEVEVATARGFKKMAAAARKAGVDLDIRSGFRSHQRQKELYRAWREGWGNKAARPGFSNHQSGRALDIDMDDHGVSWWMSRNARKFGFRRTVPGEPWHWEFTPPSATARGSSTRRRS